MCHHFSAIFGRMEMKIEIEMEKFWDEEKAEEMREIHLKNEGKVFILSIVGDFSQLFLVVGVGDWSLT